jgi:hypothetical protein
MRQLRALIGLAHGSLLNDYAESPSLEECFRIVALLAPIQHLWNALADLNDAIEADPILRPRAKRRGENRDRAEKIRCQADAAAAMEFLMRAGEGRNDAAHRVATVLGEKDPRIAKWRDKARVATVRDPDGLLASSYNFYLTTLGTAAQPRQATKLILEKLRAHKNSQ